MHVHYVHVSNMEGYKASALLTKQKYATLAQTLDGVVHDKELLGQVLQSIKDSLRFDPNVSSYNQEQGKKFVAWRKKRAEELGMTTQQYKQKHSTTT